MEELRQLIAHCLSEDAGGYTPSDVAEFDWDQEDINEIYAAIDRSAGAS